MRNDASNSPVSRRGLLGAAAALPLAACVSTRADAGAKGARADAAAANDELFAHLSDQRGSIEPIRGHEHAARRARLADLLREAGADAFLCESGPTLVHLSGVQWGRSERLFALVVLADGSHLWVCPAFEESRARRQIDAADGPGGALLAWQEHEHPFAPLAAALRERRVERLLVEPQIRHTFVDRLGTAFGAQRIASGAQATIALRGRKDAHELALLRRANELTQLAIREVAKTLRPGLTGDDVAARMAAAHARLGMRSPWALCLIGPAAALPHGDDHDVPLQRGDLLLTDVGASLHGYQSDETRTWIVDGQPSSEIERAWNVVRDAQQRAFEMLAPGVRCADVDARARSVIAAAGYGEGYAALTHRLGHGIGLEGHEDPYFDGGSQVVLAPGMTLSDEPGIYVPGRYGIRIEDIVAITERGADHFGTWQKSPASPD